MAARGLACEHWKADISTIYDMLMAVCLTNVLLRQTSDVRKLLRPLYFNQYVLIQQPMSFIRTANLNLPHVLPGEALPTHWMTHLCRTSCLGSPPHTLDDSPLPHVLPGKPSPHIGRLTSAARLAGGSPHYTLNDSPLPGKALPTLWTTH